MPTEAPPFIHTEAERAEMLTRMQDIARRDEISAGELEEVGWLILDRDADEVYDSEDGFGGQMLLPSRDKPEIALESAARGRYFYITILDGIDLNRETGEKIILDQDKKRGSLRWRVGIFNSMYSEFLGRRVEVDAGDYVMAIDSLSPGEHATLARRVVQAYQEGLTPNP